MEAEEARTRGRSAGVEFALSVPGLLSIVAILGLTIWLSTIRPWMGAAGMLVMFPGALGIMLCRGRPARLRTPARILGTFLGWLQERKRPVFVVATANDIEILPPELLRKGRFDEIFFVDLPRGAARRSIFAMHLARRRQNPADFDLGELSAAAEGFSGAEIEAAVVSALYSAFSVRGKLTGRHVLTSLGDTVPLSRTCREQVAELRKWAQGRAVPAGKTRPKALDAA